MSRNEGDGVTTDDNGTVVGSEHFATFVVKHHSASAFTGVYGLSEYARAWRRFVDFGLLLAAQ